MSTSGKSDTTTTATSTTTNNLSADDQVAVAKELMVQPVLADGGKLADNGQFLESDSSTNPFPEVEIHSYTGADGRLIVYVEGEGSVLRELAMEFDAVISGRDLAAETSYVGDQSSPPPWVLLTPNGSVRDVVEEPPPPEANEARWLGVHIPTDIRTLEEFAFLSIWLYRSLEDGAFDYVHYEIQPQALIGNTNFDVLAADMFIGLIPASAINSSLAWVLLLGG